MKRLMRKQIVDSNKGDNRDFNRVGFLTRKKMKMFGKVEKKKDSRPMLRRQLQLLDRQDKKFKKELTENNLRNERGGPMRQT